MRRWSTSKKLASVTWLQALSTSGKVSRLRSAGIISGNPALCRASTRSSQGRALPWRHLFSIERAGGGQPRRKCDTDRSHRARPAPRFAIDGFGLPLFCGLESSRPRESRHIAVSILVLGHPFLSQGRPSLSLRLCDLVPFFRGESFAR